MDFHKNRIDAASDTGTSKVFDVFRLPARCLAKSARKLQAVRHVKHNRHAKRPHYRKRTKIDDEIIVTETRAAFGQQNLFATRGLLVSRQYSLHPTARETVLS